MSASQNELQDVLIADGDDDDFELLKEAIADYDVRIEVMRAESGDILMRIINDKKPDILFLDLILPEKDGKACIAEIRQNARFDDLPIIVYSSLSDLANIEFCFRNGANLYVVKPSSYLEISKLIEQIFSVNWRKLNWYPAKDHFVLNGLSDRK